MLAPSECHGLPSRLSSSCLGPASPSYPSQPLRPRKSKSLQQLGEGSALVLVLTALQRPRGRFRKLARRALAPPQLNFKQTIDMMALPFGLATAAVNTFGDNSEEDVLLLGLTGTAIWAKASNAQVDVSELAAGSADGIMLLATLPPAGLGPRQLLQQLRAASRSLRTGGRLIAMSAISPVGGPLRALLELPDLQFEVTAEPSVEQGLWVYLCKKLETPVEAPQVPGAVKVVLEEKTSVSKELAVWTKNPQEAAFEFQEIFVDRCYGPPLTSPEAVPRGLDVSFFIEGASSHEPLVIIDAGMNLGVFGLYLQRCLAAAASSRRRVSCLAFEPAPESYTLALQNLKQAGIAIANHGSSLTAPAPSEASDGLLIHTFQLALGQEPVGATQRFCYFPKSPANSALERHRPESRWSQDEVPERVEFEVGCCRLSEAVDAVLGLEGGSNPGLFLKVDVEGAEADVLQGLEPRHWAHVVGFAIEVQGSDQLAALQQLCAEKWTRPGAEISSSRHPSTEADSDDGLYILYGRALSA